MRAHPPWQSAHPPQDQPAIERRGDCAAFVLNTADPQYSIRRRRRPLAFRLLADPAGDAHFAMADARAFRERNESRRLPRPPSKSDARSLSWIAVAPGPQGRSQADVNVWRDALV